MKNSAKILAGAMLVTAMIGLSACAGSSYTSTSVGVSSYDVNESGPRGDRDWDGIPNRFDRDRDGDGVPNRFDSKPNNPRWRE